MPRDPGSAAKLELIGDSEIRRVLATINVETSSVKQIAKEIELSESTVYRHLQRLEEHGLVIARNFVSTDGNHFHVYECNFQSAIITLERDEYDAYFSEQDTKGRKITSRCKSLYKSIVE